MEQIAILSGKGGTGKTSITASIAYLAKNAMFADCDVDASDMHLILNPEPTEINDFIGGKTAIINQDNCINCNKCFEVCRYDAVKVDKTKEKQYSINKFSCEGCRFCERVCPTQTIYMEQEPAGKWYISNTRFGKMIHARLNPGEENSGKLVSLVRHKARDIAEKEEKDYIIIDGPPGISCPVISTLSGINKAILITEPTTAALSDLKRVADTAKHFKAKVYIVINKYDLNTKMAENIENYAKENDYKIVAKIPFDKIFVEAMIEQKSITEKDINHPVSKEIIKILKILNIRIKDEYNVK